MSPVSAPIACPICRHSPLELWHTYHAPPDGETSFNLEGSGPYLRAIYQCTNCRHFVSVNSVPLDELYSNAYVDSTYGESGVAAAFERVMNLPPERSDNVQRVERIEKFMAARNIAACSVLDVGSGLCVFPARMKAHGWNCTALDPDPKAVKHAREVVGVTAIEGDFFAVDVAEQFDLLTLNKVLEHVADPAAMLKRAADFLAPQGVLYFEVPDGVGAAIEGPGREEFFIEHLHVFSQQSSRLLAEQSGFRVLELGVCREPSSKFTVYGFLEIQS